MIWMDVDTALAEVPVNICPLITAADFITVDEGVTWNEAGMELYWHFVTTGGATTVVQVTPTTGGAYDWAHQDHGMYTIEMTATGGASANNDTEGFGYFTGKCTATLAWRGPTIGFRAAALNNALVDGGDLLDVNLAEILGTALTETAGLLAGGFKKFLNVASPTGTLNSLADAVPGAAGGGFIAGTNAATTITTSLTTGAITLTTPIEANATQISGDSTAADNLELQYDGTGLIGDTYPLRQDQGASISGGLAVKANMVSVTVVLGSEQDLANTNASGGTYWTGDDDGAGAEFIFLCTPADTTAEPGDLHFEGYYDEPGGADNGATISVYNFQSAAWEGHIWLTNASKDETHDVALTHANGAPGSGTLEGVAYVMGDVLIKFEQDTQETGNACLLCDRMYVGFIGEAMTAADVNAQCDLALSDINLDHLLKVVTAAADMTTEVVDNTILSRILANGDTSAFVPSTDGLQPFRDAILVSGISSANLAKLEDILDGTGGTGIKVSTIEATGTTTLTGAVSLGSTLGITGAVTLSSTLGVGATTLGSLAITGALSVGSTTTLSGAVSLGSTLGVTGATTFTGAVTCTNGIVANITGNLSGSVGSLTGHTIQTGDSYAIVSSGTYGNAKLVRSTTPANALDVSATGEAGLDFNNIKNASGATTLTNITVPAVTTVGSVTTKTGYSLASTGLDLVTTWTTAITGNITGNLSGSVGSVTGAVGSVTGAVGSVTGAVGSVTGAVGSVTGNVGGTLAGFTTAAKAILQAECNDALVALDLDGLSAQLTALDFVGDGSIAVNHDSGGTDNLAYKTSAGVGIDNAIVRAFLTTDYDAGVRSGSTWLKGRTTTDVNGEWAADLMLDAGDYTFVFHKQGEYGIDTEEYTVS